MKTRHEGAVRIRNRLGLHARPAAEFVKLASRFDAEVWVEKEAMEVNGKSIMGVMMLAAEAGSSIRIRAEGSEAASAVDALMALVTSGFSEELVTDGAGTEPPCER
ncbi:HPr family phosphocarrier protein [Candidatus Palauibacter sp.]|uniref:HPr family phosphocarrier protein n=1 Tax=Candidatus Palauibacter sp. TaxID=3101350 RepID=UPI003B017863